MAGQIKEMLNTIIRQCAQGDPFVASLTKTKLTLKGINPDRYDGTTPDDAATIAKLKAIAKEMGIAI